MIELRLAACDVYLKRYPQAREALRAHIDRPGPLQSEAQYFYLTTIRELGREDEYLSLARTFVDTYPDRALAEQTLNELGTYFILKNEDGQAADVFAELRAPLSARRRSRIAPPGRPAGGPTRTATTPRRFGCSSRRR